MQFNAFCRIIVPMKTANLLKLKDSPFYGRLFKKLTDKDLKFCTEFCEQNSGLSKDQWYFKINRLGLDQADKPKNLNVICEILQVSF